MMSLSVIVSYLFLFVALCIFVFLSIALINIFGKSYQPSLVIPLIIIVVILFAFNTIAGYSSIRKTFQNISNSTPTPLRPNSDTKNVF
jgi:TRAP-type C4-dicarboxylate transport system permease small subunit